MAYNKLTVGPDGNLNRIHFKRRNFMINTRISKAIVATALGIFLGGGYFRTEINA